MNVSPEMSSRPVVQMARPLLGGEQVRAVERIIRSGQLAQGVEVAQFERRFAEYVGAPYAVALSSGTAALELGLAALGVGPGDEVVTVPFSFFATTAAILRVGATPVFVDIRVDDFLMDHSQLDSVLTERTRAIIPVDLYGQMADIAAILDRAARRGIAVLEDACQAHGASRGGRKAGSLTNTAFSFYATKNLPIGEGGILTTNDESVAARCRSLANHGMEQKYVHERVGTNSRMTNLLASIGNSALGSLDAWNGARARNAQFLCQGLQEVDVRLPAVPRDATHVWHQFTIVVPGEGPNGRDSLAEYLRTQGIASAVHYPIPIHLQPALKGRFKRGDFPVSEYMAEHVLSLPIHPGLSDEDLWRIVEAVRGWSDLSPSARAGR